ncbi:hypothetical protein QZH41_017634, partial [Actinostola sp. cb2023]
MASPEFSRESLPSRVCSFKSITEDIQSEELVSDLRSSKRASKLVERRQKLIKLADKSEAGWLAVDEYESDELADDSADEKRIKKAQEKATKKRKDNAKSLAATAAPRNTRSLPYSSRRQDSSFFRAQAVESLGQKTSVTPAVTQAIGAAHAESHSTSTEP